MRLKTQLNNICDKLNLPRIELIRVSSNSYYSPGFGPFQEEVIAIQKNIRPRDQLQTLYHEIGHYFYEYFKRDIDFIPKEKFKSLFGNPSTIGYYANFALISAVENLSGLEAVVEQPGFISKYAQYHTHEDWAETFAWGLRDWLAGRNKDYKDKLINQKVKFVKECIQTAHDWEGEYYD